MSYRLAADVGGTFTDIVLLNDTTGVYETTKVLTTPEALEKGILKGFDELAGDKYAEITSIVHGTTSGLNSVIERRGAHCALVTTRGFRDVYEIARAMIYIMILKMSDADNKSIKTIISKLF